MSSPFIGEIRMFGSSFAPAGWAMCSGQLMPISQNDTLFNLIGTTYGGDGQETFALPNLAGRVPLCAGTNAGQTFQLGEMAGVESVTLTTQQMPVHNHAFICTTDFGTKTNPTGNLYAANGTVALYTDPNGDTLNKPLNSNQGPTPIGGNQPHENMMPYLCITFIISLFGIFPTQN
jgi:microcystin-dependent protein